MTLPEPVVISSPHGRIVCDPTWRAWLEERGYLSGIPDASTERAVFFESLRRENARRSDGQDGTVVYDNCLLYTSPSPRDATLSRMPSSA